MINKEDFELHKSIVEWLMSNDVPFMQAMSIVSFAEQTNRSMPIAYIDLLTNVDHKNSENKSKLNLVGSY